MSPSAITPDRQTPNSLRLRELVLYISQESEGDFYFGVTKLYKLLFFSDFIAYRLRGQSLTGYEYQKLPNGPAPRHILPLFEEMTESNLLTIRDTTVHGYEQHKPIALRDALLGIFDGDDIALVSRLIRRFWGKTAAEMSALSHEFVGWQAAELNETIPYQVALVSTSPPTQQMIDTAKRLDPVAKRRLDSAA